MKKQKQLREGVCSHCRRRTQHILEWRDRRWDKVTERLPEDAFQYPSYYLANKEKRKMSAHLWPGNGKPVFMTVT